MSKLRVKSDIVFKRIFAHKGNEEFLIQFLSALLKVNITSIDIMHDIHLEKDIEEDKLGILDVRAIIDKKEIVNIEIQIKDLKNIVQRSTFYASKIVSNQLVQAEQYQNIKPVIAICILDYEFLPYEDYINDTKTVLSNHRDYEINSYVKYIYIELPKFRKSVKKYDDIISQWLTFIDGVNSRGLEEAMEKNETVRKAQEELEYLEGDEAFKRKVELKEKYEKDMNSAIHYGREEGMKKGLQEGLQKGLQEGKTSEKKDIAKKMLEIGMNVEQIMKITDLSKEEIEKSK